MTATYKTYSQVEPLARAVRTVGRWGLAAGVTGFLGNVLLAVLFTTPADGPYAWTGPANDVIGVVSTLAIVALLAMAAVELAYVLGLAGCPARWPAAAWRWLPGHAGFPGQLV